MQTPKNSQKTGASLSSHGLVKQRTSFVIMPTFLYLKGLYLGVCFPHPLFSAIRSAILQFHKEYPPYKRATQAATVEISAPRIKSKLIAKSSFNLSVA